MYFHVHLLCTCLFVGTHVCNLTELVAGTAIEKARNRVSEQGQLYEAWKMFVSPDPIQPIIHFRPRTYLAASVVANPLCGLHTHPSAEASQR